MKNKITYCCRDCGYKIDRHNALNGLGRCFNCLKLFRKIPINAANYIDGRSFQKYYCKNCKKLISQHSALAGKGRCKSCSHKGIKRPQFSKSIKGKNNPNYKHGLSFKAYPSEFNKELKLKIRQRDNFECQNCYMIEEEHKKRFHFNLVPHHIDYNKLNCKESNLITLCQNCNLIANGNRDYWFSFYIYKVENI